MAPTITTSKGINQLERAWRSSHRHVLMEGSHNEQTAVRKALDPDTILIPVHAVVSRPARRAYLSTFLFATASAFLFGISGLAYTLFYYSYVPQISIERVIHLQFGDGSPYGIASLSSTLTSYQPYDITLFLHLPRTPNNIAVGNFMLDLCLLAPHAKIPTTEKFASSFSAKDASTPIIMQSKRSAILTYSSSIVDLASTISGMPWYLLGWKKESEVLEVRMFEGVEFEKGWKNIPQSAKVTIDADEKMQIYSVEIKIMARFKGLRWLLYHHRILSFMFFSSAFWASSMIFTMAAWLILSARYSSPPSEKFKSDTTSADSITKVEPSESEDKDPSSAEDLSDASRSFPTYGRQMPLHFSRRKEAASKVHTERVEKKEGFGDSTGRPPLNAETDDEEDDKDIILGGWRDSGIGTSLDDRGRMGIERRRSALLGGKGKGA